MKRSRGLGHRSAKQAERDEAINDAIYAAKERDRWRCQARALVPTVACLGGLDGQHIIPRSVRRDLAADVTNIITVCRGHHDWIDRNPESARAVGLHGFSWDRP